MDSTPQTQTHQLPQELIDLIIDDDSHNLDAHKAFALVSKSFLHQSRRHFFRDLWFCADDKRCRELQAHFWAILHANPGIAAYVRTVRIEDGARGEALDEGVGERPSWIREEENFQRILLALAKAGQITELMLEMDLDWRSFSGGLQDALARIMTTPTLEKLSISDLKGLPVSCCMRFPKLDKLSVSGITMVESVGFQRGELASVSISSLSVSALRRESARILSNILGLGATAGPPAVLNIRKLRILTSDAGCTRDIVWAARKSLQVLSLSIKRMGNLINLSDLTMLNRLELHIFHQQDDHWQTDALGILESGTSISNQELRTVHIKLFHGSYHHWVEHLSNQNTVLFWRRLDTVLERFPDVKDLVIELVVFGLDSEPSGIELKEEQSVALRQSVYDGLLGDGDGANGLGARRRVIRVDISFL